MTLQRQTAALVIPLLLALALVSAAGRFAMERYESDWGLREELRGTVLSIGAHLEHALQRQASNHAGESVPTIADAAQYYFEQHPQVLERLHEQKSLLAICLYSSEGILSHAAFLRKEFCSSTLNPQVLSTLRTETISTDFDLSAEPARGIGAVAIRLVTGGGGILTSVNDISEIVEYRKELLIACAGYFAAALVTAVIVVVLISRTLRRALTELTARTLAMLRVAQEQPHSPAFAPKTSDSQAAANSRIIELEELSSAFSTMRAIYHQVLAKVRQRYSALERYRGARGLQEAFSQFCKSELTLTKGWHVELLRCDQPGWFLGSEAEGRFVFFGKVDASNPTDAVCHAAAAQLLLAQRLQVGSAEDAIASVHGVLRLARLTVVYRDQRSIRIARLQRSHAHAGTFSVSNELKSLEAATIVPEVPEAALSLLEACTRVCAHQPIEALASMARKVCGSGEGAFLAITKESLG